MNLLEWCGSNYRGEFNETHLGYPFKKRAWEEDIPQKLAYASMKYGFKELNLSRITASAETDNIATWKVLEKCGMRYIGDHEVEGFPVRVYEIFNPSVQ